MSACFPLETNCDTAVARTVQTRTAAMSVAAWKASNSSMSTRVKVSARLHEGHKSHDFYVFLFYFYFSVIHAPYL